MLTTEQKAAVRKARWDFRNWWGMLKYEFRDTPLTAAFVHADALYAELERMERED